MTDERLDSVAIICDGNGRWAKRRGLMRSAGHVAGAKRIQPTLEKFREIGVHHVTLYCFSTENWKRPKDEIDVIMKLIYKYLDEVVVEKIKTDKNFCVKEGHILRKIILGNKRKSAFVSVGEHFSPVCKIDIFGMSYRSDDFLFYFKVHEFHGDCVADAEFLRFREVVVEPDTVYASVIICTADNLHG